MNNPQSQQISIDFLSWINDELRKEIDRQAALDDDDRNGFVERMKTYLFAGLSGVSAILIGMLN